MSPLLLNIFLQRIPVTVCGHLHLLMRISMLLAYNLCYCSRTSHQPCFRHSRFLTAIRCSTTAAVSRNDKFYCHCLPNNAQTLKSLDEALKGSTKHFKWSARFYVDASASHDGAVLQYIQNRGWVPLSFFSKQLVSTQS